MRPAFFCSEFEVRIIGSSLHRVGERLPTLTKIFDRQGFTCRRHGGSGERALLRSRAEHPLGIDPDPAGREPLPSARPRHDSGRGRRSLGVPRRSEHLCPQPLERDGGRRAVAGPRYQRCRLPPRLRPVPRPSVPASNPVTPFSRSTARPIASPEQIVVCASRCVQGSAADLPRDAAAALRRHFHRRCRADSVGSAGPLLRAGGRRNLLARGRRRRAAASSREPGDAALLLALSRVLRRARVLVQRPTRPARQRLLLGRRRVDAACCRRSSCTSRWCSRSGPTAGSRAETARTLLPLLYLPARAARRRARRDDHAGRSARRRAVERDRR